MYYPCSSLSLSLQSEEPVQLPSNPNSGKTDLIEYENPADLIKALLEQLGGSASLNKICKVQTAVHSTAHYLMFVCMHHLILLCIQV